MGKGRDKRKKHEDPLKAVKRADKTAAKLTKGEKKAAASEDGTNIGGLNGEIDVAVMVQQAKKLRSKGKQPTEKDVAPPSARANAACVAHPTRPSEVVIFGGEIWDGETTRPYDDLLIFNHEKNVWRKIESPGGPTARSSSQMWAYKSFIFVHGGEFVSQSQSQFMHFRDTHRMDMNTCLWEELTAGQPGTACPSARSGHRITTWRAHSAVLFGGFYDNALESRYYDDLWVLSDIAAGGKWTLLGHPASCQRQNDAPPLLQERPHARSGHTLAIHKDTAFLYGGYFMSKVNRFTRAESTVFHDLWSVQLGVPPDQTVWQKLKLGGIPPPIRCGMGSAVHRDGKRLFLFGGVVDVDGVGGQTVSTFHNDIFVFHMDKQKFFPLTLTGPKKTFNSTSQAAKKDDDLAAELAALGVDGNSNQDDGEDSADDDEDDDLLADAPAPQLTAAALAMQQASHITQRNGQVLPCRRMNPLMAFTDSAQLILIGGQYEVGKKETTLADAFKLNINKLESYVVLREHDLSQTKWLGEESDVAEGEWEDGSTVADIDALAAALDDDDEDFHNEEYDEDPHVVAQTLLAEVNCDADEDEAPELESVGGKFAQLTADAPTIDSRVSVKGQGGLQRHKKQLQDQLSSSHAVPTPLTGETLKAFFIRTEKFWFTAASESVADDATLKKELKKREQKVIKKAAVGMAEMRYNEASLLVEQLAAVEAQEKAEREALRAHLQNRKKAQEAENEQDAGESSESSEQLP